MRHMVATFPILAMVTLWGSGCNASQPSSQPAKHEASVAPGINEPYQDHDAEKWINRFERDDREVYAQREAIVRDLNVSPGSTVADIGAGTGLYTLLLSESVGAAGKVYAVDVDPDFIALIRHRAKAADLENITAVLCKEDSVELPAASIDLAFICDTYHHFEYPRSTMTSLRQALRPGGQVVIVDFAREEGESRQWTLDHVRAGKQKVIEEIESYGFKLLADEPPTAKLKDNYFLRFQRTPE